MHIDGVEIDTYHRWMDMTISAALAGRPCIGVPAGFSAEGLRIGVQLIARPPPDLGVLRVAHAHEAAARDPLGVPPAEPRP